MTQASCSPHLLLITFTGPTMQTLKPAPASLETKRNLKNQNNNTTTAVLVTAAPFTHLPQLETCKSISQSCSWHRAASATREKRGITAETSPGAVSHGRANRSPATQTLNTHTQSNLTIAASEGGCNMSSTVTTGPRLSAVNSGIPDREQTQPFLSCRGWWEIQTESCQQKKLHKAKLSNNER